MRWEDQELNHGTLENKFPEVLYAGLSLPCRAASTRGTFLQVDQSALDAMIESGTLNAKARGVRIDRLCLYFRLSCRLGPGGNHYPELGARHFWYGGESLYAISYISPENDWLSIMVVPGEAPNSPLQRTPGSAAVPNPDASGTGPLLRNVGLRDNMADSSEIVQEFLAAMGPVREALGDFVCALYKRAEVKLIHEFHPLAYVCSDFGISAELRNGAVVDFWIDLEQADSQWQLRYSVQRHDPDEDGSHAEHDFPAQKVASAMNLPAAIVSAIGDLRRASADDKLFR